MKVSVSWTKSGEPMGIAAEPLEVPKGSLRVSPKGTVYLYLTAPAVISDDDGRPLLRTQISGSLILRASPILE